MPKSTQVKENSAKYVPQPKMEKIGDPLQEKISNSSDIFPQHNNPNMLRNQIEAGSMAYNYSKPQEAPESVNILALKSTRIQDVWDDNMEEEIYRIMNLVDKYSVIAMVKIREKKIVFRWKNKNLFKIKLFHSPFFNQFFIYISFSTNNSL